MYTGGLVHFRRHDAGVRSDCWVRTVLSGMLDTAVVTAKGSRRWDQGHPWIYRSDVSARPSCAAGAVSVLDRSGKALGWALWSPHSEISLRLLDRRPDATIDEGWWHSRIAAALSRRKSLSSVASAYRLVHGEADGCPSVICDRYDRWLVIQLLSAGAESFRDAILSAIGALFQPEGILARNDVPVRDKERLPRLTECLRGSVPREIEVHEHGIRYLAAPWDGQKTGAFLDQRENRALVAQVAVGRALDCFSYHGSFALHLARQAASVIALDASAAALTRARQNARLNGSTNIEFKVADAFEFLRAEESSSSHYDTIVLDPPAFAKTKSALPGALRGYKEINLRAMRILRPGGLLFSASCSFHLSKPLFLEMLEEAASDSGRRLALRDFRGQPIDHPEVLTIPETGYLKGALIEALD